MRRLAVLVAVVVAVAAGCHSSDPIRTASGATVHWRSTTAGQPVRQIAVVVPAQYATPSTMHAVNVAVEQANRSPYIHMVIDVPAVAPATCEACVLVSRGPLAYPVVARTSSGWDTAGHMYGMAVRVILDNSRPHTQGVLDNAGCHEIAGHGLGLTHSSDGGTGPCQGAVLTDWDRKLIDTAHRHVG